MLRLLKKPESHRSRVFQQLFVIICLAVINSHCRDNIGLIDRHPHYRDVEDTTRPPPKHAGSKKTCMEMDSTLRARKNACFLRPDTGPCRADILQWYFDARQARCWRFFWGGCQGNGNRFETQHECLEYCFLDAKSPPKPEIPHFCELAFDYGTCFGHYNRWTWDYHYKTCKRRIYSGCGGNQNNFETQLECVNSCLIPPNNTLQMSQQYTTCIPFNIPELQRK